MISRAVCTTYFKGKKDFIGKWLERNNLSKLKSVFEGASA